MVYIIQQGQNGPIKIGFTNKSAYSRAKQLQIGSGEKLHVIATFPGDKIAERSLHERFSRFRVGGEWFSVDLLGYLFSDSLFREVRETLAKQQKEKTLEAIGSMEDIVQTLNIELSAHDVLALKRGPRRRASYGQIVIETLKTCDKKPTRDELQKLSKIRRSKFIPILKNLLETEQVFRSGDGSKFRPYKYSLTSLASK